MSDTLKVEKVEIRPESSILTVLSHLNYSAWYAIAEFVDNSIQSYQTHREKLRELEGSDFRLQIRVKFDRENEVIEIFDNAAGIFSNDYQRAFRPAAIPEKNTGLSEFGMGMKSAACWFTWTWSVRSKALGETVERQVWFDVKNIASEKLDKLPVKEISATKNLHYTIIRLESLGTKFPVTKTYTKIRSHLASIYREFFRTGEIEIYFDKEDQPLKYEDPIILNAPPADGSSKEPVEWRKDISFTLDGGKTVKGFAGIRRDGSTTHAGFALFRRNRLIYGSDDETYRPAEIFGRSNDFRYQRIFGELHLSGFEVSHTKDGFNWADTEGIFIENLREQLKATPLDLLTQAHKYRSRVQKSELINPIINEVKEVKRALNRPEARVALSKENGATLEPRPQSKSLFENPTDSSFKEDFKLEVDNQNWLVRFITNTDPTASDWIDVRQIEESVLGDADCGIEITLFSGHRVIANHLGPNLENLGFMVRLAITLGLAKEKSSRLGSNVGPFMYWLNRIMREADLDA